MTSKELLINAKKLIEDPNNWVQKAYALDKDDNKLVLQFKEDIKGAVKWCALGACYTAAYNLGAYLFDWDLNSEVISLLITACKEIISPWELDQERQSVIMLVNDCLGHKYIMQAFDRAIELAGD